MKKHEQVQVREEAPVPRIVLHVADRVDVDQRTDPRHDQDHRDRQRIHAQVERRRWFPTVIHSDDVLTTSRRSVGGQRQQVCSRTPDAITNAATMASGRQHARPPPQPPADEQVHGRTRPAAADDHEAR